MQKLLWFACGLTLGFTALSITRASVPNRGRVTDDTAIYQRLSEIQVKKEALIDFDFDIDQLLKMESRYQERLPSLVLHSRLKNGVKRVSQQKYRLGPSNLAQARAQSRLRR